MSNIEKLTLYIRSKRNARLILSFLKSITQDVGKDDAA